MKFKITKLSAVLVVIWTLNSIVSAQQTHVHEHNPKTCKSTEQQEAFWKANPEAYQEHLAEEAKQKALITHLKSSRLKSARSSEKYIIPIVFHVFGDVQSNKQVTYELIKDALDKVNADFEGKSPGQDDIHNRFQNVVDFLPVEFRLANIDPKGNICTGVTFNPVKKGFGNGSGYDEEIQKYAWDNKKYMNVYIMNDLYDDGDYYNSGVSWYPNTWMTNNNLARTVYNGAYIGNNTNENFRRVLTHEFGHFFNLAHTFYGGCPEENGGDHCADTPAADKAHMGVDEKNCHGHYTNTQNFMNYTSDYQMYTKDQVIRMKAAMQHPSRITLWSDENLIATGVNDGFDPGKALVYTTNLFDEAFINDGSINTTIGISLIGGVSFNATSFISGTHYNVSNLPEGLELTIKSVNTSTASIEIKGKATEHEKNASINNLTIEFLQAAFNYPIAEIKNTRNSTLSLNFIDTYTTYSYPKTQFRAYAGITNVSFANVNNNSNVNYMTSYLDNYVGIVKAGQTIDLSITLNKHDTGTNDYYIIHAWMDKNGDFVYNKDEEIVDHTMQFTQADQNGNYTYTKQITIPNDIVTGRTTGIRIIANFKTKYESMNGYDPYGTYESGELEDYGIIVKPVVEEPTADILINTPKILIKHKAKFSDFSNTPDNDPISSWNWSFPGGEPANYNGTNPPEIYYEAPGKYNVSLKISSQSGITKSITKEEAVQVVEEYCQPAISYATYGGITNVKLGNIDNTTTNSGSYRSYRDTHIATMKTGDLIPFSVTLDPGKSGDNDNLGVALWIDWNHNSVLEENEKAFYQKVNTSQFTSGKMTLTSNLEIPLDAITESTLARVMVYYAGDDGNFISQACSGIDSGEIEDYGINIEHGNITTKVRFDASNSTPNIADKVTFTNNSISIASDPIKTYNWTFEKGNPSTSNEKEPTVFWKEEGKFNVSLTTTTQSGKSTTLTKEKYIDVDYHLCEVNPSSGTGYGHIDRIQIGNIDYSTPSTNVPANTNLIKTHIINAPSSTPIPFTVTLSKGESGDKDGIGLKVFFDSDRNGYTSSEMIFKDWFKASSTNDQHVMQGSIEVPESFEADKVMAIRFMAYFRGYNEAETYNPDPCGKIDSGNAIDLGIKFKDDVPEMPTNVKVDRIGVTFFSLSWDNAEGAISYEVQLRKPGGQWVNHTTNTNSFQYTSANAKDNYEFRICAKNDKGNSDFTTVQSITTLSELVYCASNGASLAYEYIDLVRLNEINNATTDNEGYGDFTNRTANIAKGTLQTIYLSCGFKSKAYTEYFRVWIDYNQNGIFEDAEKIAEGASNSDEILSHDFTVPANAIAGTTRMRVSLRWNKYAQACGTIDYGEVEDYSVNISSNTSRSVLKSSIHAQRLTYKEEGADLRIYPIPTKDILYVNFIDEEIQYSIINSVGKEVLNGSGNGRSSINVSLLPTGIYFIKVYSEGRSINARFIKK